MLNNFDIRYSIARDKWFDRKKNVHIHHKQEAYKGYKQTVEIDADVSVTI